MTIEKDDQHRVTPVAPPKREALRPVVARIPAATAHEIRDCVIHRNGGQADGPNTVSQFRLFGYSSG